MSTSQSDSAANVSMIVGDDGVVIVDTGMTRDDADRIVTEFRKISDKPVKAIIFTHSHGDHTGGATSFLGSRATANLGSQQLRKRISSIDGCRCYVSISASSKASWIQVATGATDQQRRRPGSISQTRRPRVRVRYGDETDTLSRRRTANDQRGRS